MVPRLRMIWDSDVRQWCDHVKNARKPCPCELEVRAALLVQLVSCQVGTKLEVSLNCHYPIYQCCVFLEVFSPIPCYLPYRTSGYCIHPHARDTCGLLNHYYKYSHRCLKAARAERWSCDSEGTGKSGRRQ